MMRKLAWRNVFLACAAIICINFIFLLTYKEPGKADRLEKARVAKAGSEKKESLLVESLRELSRSVWAAVVVPRPARRPGAASPPSSAPWGCRAGWASAASPG